jgi:hypothetical protein
MRLVAVFLAGACLAGTLTSAPAAAQQSAEPSAAAASKPEPAAPSSGTDVKGELPVSLDRIRTGLEQPTARRLFSGDAIKGVDKQAADFRTAIEERRKIEELLATLDFKSGPVPAGGLYAYEQQRLITPPVDNPLAQPYAAFNQGQLLTILVENLVGKYLAGQAADAISRSARERAETAARRDVESAVADYCAGKPNHGAGVDLCTPAPDSPH